MFFQMSHYVTNKNNIVSRTVSSYTCAPIKNKKEQRCPTLNNSINHPINQILHAAPCHAAAARLNALFAVESVALELEEQELVWGRRHRQPLAAGLSCGEPGGGFCQQALGPAFTALHRALLTLRTTRVPPKGYTPFDTPR